jgi:spore maturation protein CgeB
LVEAPLGEMADTIERYLADHAARERIAEAAYRLVTSELTMANGIRRIVDHWREREAAGGQRA